jgi:Protein of unknown function (DUF664)
MRLDSDDTAAGIAQLYASACSRSRSTLARCDSLDHVGAVPSFGIGPVNLRWIPSHMIDETARRAGHLDLLRDSSLAGSTLALPPRRLRLQPAIWGGCTKLSDEQPATLVL